MDTHDTPVSPITYGGHLDYGMPPQVFENADGTMKYVYYDRNGPTHSEIHDKTGRKLSVPERGGDYDVPGRFR